MKEAIAIILITILIVGCVSKKNLLIEENKFNQARINETSLEALKVKHPFAKREKKFKSIMWRTDEGRVCETRYTETLTKKRKGVKMIFLYSGSDKVNERVIKKIVFSKKSYYLKNGIRINESKLSDVDSLYENVVTVKNEDGIIKRTNTIHFFSFYSKNKDTVETKMLVNQISIE